MSLTSQWLRTESLKRLEAPNRQHTVSEVDALALTSCDTTACAPFLLLQLPILIYLQIKNKVK